MPIYEYECADCSHRFERLQKIGDAPLRDCPQCDKPALSKLVSAAAFRLKGSGWYETDFKGGKKKNLTGGADDSSSGASNGDGASKPSSADGPSGSGGDGGSGDSAAKSADKPDKKPGKKKSGDSSASAA